MRRGVSAYLPLVKHGALLRGLSQASAFAATTATSRRAGCHIAAIAPNSDKAAKTPIAGANPVLKVWAELAGMMM
jgi:hypothetical protein